MYPESFEYHAPATVEEAVELLGQYGEEARIITGGMSLVPLMKLRLASPAHLIDLRRVEGLAGISQEGESIVIGARATYYELESSALLRKKCPLVAQTAARVGDVQVRNRGTIGGSLVHADPAADLPAAMVALDAQITLRGKAERTMAAGDFFRGILTSAAEPGEILTHITVPETGAATAYAKMAQLASGFALAGVAVALEMKGKTCVSARIGVTGVSPAAFRAGSVEDALAGQTLDAETVRAVAEHVASDIEDPLNDRLNASSDYRVHIAKVIAGRAIAQAAGL